MKLRTTKKFSNNGNRYRLLYELGKNGLLIHKMVKDKTSGKYVRDKFDLWQDIQDRNVEPDFKSKLSCAENQDKVMKMVKDYVSNANNDDIIYKDYTTGVDYVDLLDSYAKLKQSFPNQYGYGDDNFPERVRNWLDKRMKFYNDRSKEQLKTPKVETPKQEGDK